MEDHKAIREQKMREILSYVWDNGKLPESSYEGTNPRIVKECVDENFLENVKLKELINGEVRFVSTMPYVTKKGCEFLSQPTYEESEAGRKEEILRNISDNTKSLVDIQRIADAASSQAALATKKAKRADIKGWLSLGIAALALVIQLIANWTVISTFLCSLFNNIT